MDTDTAMDTGMETIIKSNEMDLFNYLTPRKRSILTVDLLQDMTDIHTHLLPGVDDGIGSFEEAVETLLSLTQIGVKNVYLTPHVMDIMPEDYRERFEKKYNQLCRQAPEGINIRLAGEYMLDTYFIKHLENGLLSFSDSYVLVETSYAAPPLNLDNLLYEITLEGYTPVLAHPERYIYMSQKDYVRLKRKGYPFQMNLLSVTGYYGKTVKKKASALLKSGFYDFTGSDIHNIEKFNAGIKIECLNRKEEAAIQKLIENNRLLW